jgi:hypothetical protein
MEEWTGQTINSYANTEMSERKGKNVSVCGGFDILERQKKGKKKGQNKNRQFNRKFGSKRIIVRVFVRLLMCVCAGRVNQCV